jgi:rhodanese-related sulfurtransferase
MPSPNWAIWSTVDFVLDVRKPDEFTVGHIRGAVNLPYQALTSHLDRLPEGRDEPILIYLNGGLHRWQRENRPVEPGNP